MDVTGKWKVVGVSAFGIGGVDWTPVEEFKTSALYDPNGPFAGVDYLVEFGADGVLRTLSAANAVKSTNPWKQEGGRIFFDASPNGDGSNWMEITWEGDKLNFVGMFLLEKTE